MEEDDDVMLVLAMVTVTMMIKAIIMKVRGDGGSWRSTEE